MGRRIVVLDSAKAEFRDIKTHVTGAFAAEVWRAVNAEYKRAVALIKANLEIGSAIDALQEVGMVNVKCVLVRQTRVVYEFDDELVIIHMFIATRRDFRSHLLQRLLSC